MSAEVRWTAARRRALEVLATSPTGSARVGEGMWDDAGDPTVSATGAAWLVHVGFATRPAARADLVKAGRWRPSVRITGAGRVAYVARESVR